MHWLTLVGLLIIAIGTALTIWGQQIVNSESNERITTLSQKNIQLSTELNKINQDISASVTGGESFCYLFPTPSFTELNTIDFYLSHKGKYPVYDVSIKIWDASCLSKIDHGKIHEAYFGYKTKELRPEEWEKMKSDPAFLTKNADMQKEIQQLMTNCLLVNNQFGTIPPNQSANVIDPPLIKLTIPRGTDHKKFSQEYDITINSRNGFFRQKIKIDLPKKRYHVHSVVEKILSDTERNVVREYESQDSEGFVIKLLK
ncbi:MAG: hypothetical protein AB2L12_12675 [Smithellaceae bacterium]